MFVVKIVKNEGMRPFLRNSKRKFYAVGYKHNAPNGAKIIISTKSSIFERN